MSVYEPRHSKKVTTFATPTRVSNMTGRVVSMGIPKGISAHNLSAMQKIKELGQQPERISDAFRAKLAIKRNVIGAANSEFRHLNQPLRMPEASITQSDPVIRQRGSDSYPRG